MSINTDDINRIINGEHIDPHTILGLHETDGGGYTVRAFIKNADYIDLIIDGDDNKYRFSKIDDRGFFEVCLENKKNGFRYNLEITDYEKNTFELDDPYRFLPQITPYDMHLFNEGNHHMIYKKLGAHIKTLDNVEGVSFAVWAPTAKRVSVVGDFNNWDGLRHQMRRIAESGVWEIFIPHLVEGDIYKYEIKTQKDEIYLKADPYAFCSERRPLTSSRVWDIEKYKWTDEKWLEKRKNNDVFKEPLSVYEVHLGTWMKTGTGDNDFLNYKEIADRLIKYVKEMNYTHIEIMPIMEHPFDGSWGYQITGYYSVTSRYGTPEEFMYLIDKCHNEGIGIILDWVPSHFPKDGHGLPRFDGTALYEHEDEIKGEHKEWGTHIFNYGRHEVRNFLVSNAVFWFEKYHIDGLRVDAVASMIYLDFGRKDGEWTHNQYGGRENIEAIEFIRQLNYTVYNYFPGIMMIAEESTAWAMVTKPTYVGGLGFTFKWNMGWMNDYLRYLKTDPLYRKDKHNNITFSIMYMTQENYILALSHDEVVHGKRSMVDKMPGDYWQKFAGLRAAYGYMYGHPGKKLLFMGNDFAQFIEWKQDDSLDWHLLDYDLHGKMKEYVKELNRLYITEKALHEEDFSYDGFEWIDCNNAEKSMVAFIRYSKDKKEKLVFIVNFTPVGYTEYSIGTPFKGFHKEILNSDASIYGGTNMGNLGGIKPLKETTHGKEYTLKVNIPPYGVLVFKPEKAEKKKKN
jgi:1,4-alpha-glucan branching enzyme